MTPKPFFIEFYHRNKSEIAEVKPCCQDDNVFYYDIFMRNVYQFTITPSFDPEKGLEWKISLKNADKRVEAALVNAIGEQIESHILLSGNTPDFASE